MREKEGGASKAQAEEGIDGWSVVPGECGGAGFYTLRESFLKAERGEK